MPKRAVHFACLIFSPGLWGCGEILGTEFDDKRLRSEPPQAGNTELVVVKGTKNNTGLLPASDLENDSLTYSLVSKTRARALALESTLGRLTLADAHTGVFKYEANGWDPKNYEDIFEYQVNDGRQDAASPGRLTVRLLPRGPIKRMPSDDIQISEPAGFGRSVDIQGDTAVVGAVNDSVVVLKRQPSGDWKFEARIVKRQDSMNFGAEVALEGEWLLVGDPGHELPDGKLHTPGQAHFYRRLETGEFGYEHTVRSAEIDDGFGKEVALSKPASCASGGDCVNAAIGANGHDEKEQPDVGAVFMYAVPSSQPELQSIKLIPRDGQAYDHFGTEVALDGDTLATVAASWRVGQNGTAYIFERQASGDWVDSGARLVPPGDRHGTIGHLGLTQGRLLCGAPQPPGGAGMAYLWEKDAQGNWGEPLPISPPPGSPGEFGETVAIGGDVLVATASVETKGAFAYFYRKTPTGWDFTTPERIETANDAAPLFGFDAVVSEQTVAIVAPHEFDSINEEIEKPDYSGAVYFYNVPKWGTD